MAAKTKNLTEKQKKALVARNYRAWKATKDALVAKLSKMPTADVIEARDETDGDTNAHDEVIEARMKGGDVEAYEFMYRACSPASDIAEAEAAKAEAKDPGEVRFRTSIFRDREKRVVGLRTEMPGVEEYVGEFAAVTTRDMTPEEIDLGLCFVRNTALERLLIETTRFLNTVQARVGFDKVTLAERTLLNNEIRQAGLALPKSQRAKLPTVIQAR